MSNGVRRKIYIHIIHTLYRGIRRVHMYYADEKLQAEKRWAAGIVRAVFGLP